MKMTLPPTAFLAEGQVHQQVAPLRRRRRVGHRQHDLLAAAAGRAEAEGQREVLERGRY